MKNILIAIFFSATVALGALDLQRQKRMAELQAQLADVQNQLANKAKAESNALNAGRRLQAAMYAMAKSPEEKTRVARELAKASLAARPIVENPLAAMMKDPKTRQLMMSQQKAMFGPVLDKKYADFFQ